MKTVTDLLNAFYIIFFWYELVTECVYAYIEMGNVRLVCWYFSGNTTNFSEKVVHLFEEVLFSMLFAEKALYKKVPVKNYSIYITFLQL